MQTNRSEEFIYKLRVYFEDTDCLGVVYHSNYLKFIERARTELLNSKKIDQQKLIKKNIIFVVRNIKINYLKSACFNDELFVKTQILQIKNASVTFLQTIENKLQNLIIKAEVNIASICFLTKKPKALPNDIKETLCQ